MISRFFITFLALILFSIPVTAQENTVPQALEIEQIPREFLVEADAFYQRCSTTAQFYQYYNCDCLAAEYLDARINDPFAQEGILIMRVKKQCIDPMEAVGYEYSSCMENGTIFPEGVDPADYCECYAREYGRVFSAAGKSPSGRLITAVIARAHLNCQP